MIVAADADPSKMMAKQAESETNRNLTENGTKTRRACGDAVK